MKLILKSLLSGFICMLVVLSFGLDGSHVNGLAVAAIGIIGFLLPGLYTIGKIYEMLKKQA